MKSEDEGSAKYATFFYSLEGYISKCLLCVLLCVSGTVCFKSCFFCRLAINVDLLL
jgi:hypothetical protein